MRSRQRGNFVIGLIVGVVLGLGVALGVAVYVTKVPIPFVTKNQPRGADQDEAEARKNRDWDPNSPLAGKPQAPRTPPQPIAPAPGPTAPAVAGAPASTGTLNAPAPAPVVVAPKPATAPSTSTDPLGDFARSRAGGTPPSTTVASAPPTTGPDPFVYFVQAGAFRTNDDAEAQRAKLSLMGVEAKVTEREQAGRTVFRVRAGPFNKKDDADRLKDRLDGGGFDAALVRVQR